MNAMEIKISKASKGISGFLKIGSISLLLAAVLAVLGLCILTFANAETQASFLAAFQTTSRDGVILTVLPRHLFWLLLAMLSSSAFMSLIFYTVYQIFREVSIEHTPFKYKHVIRMKRIAAMILLMSIIGSFSDSLLDLFTIHEMGWHLDFSGILLGIVLYCLALFFEYGCMLQQQSDETL